MQNASIFADYSDYDFTSLVIDQSIQQRQPDYSINNTGFTDITRALILTALCLAFIFFVLYYTRPKNRSLKQQNVFRYVESCPQHDTHIPYRHSKDRNISNDNADSISNDNANSIDGIVGVSVSSKQESDYVQQPIAVLLRDKIDQIRAMQEQQQRLHAAAIARQTLKQELQQQQEQQQQEHQQQQERPRWSRMQSVHDQGVVNTCKNAVAQALEENNQIATQINDVSGTTMDMINRHATGDQRLCAQNTLNTITRINANTPYGMREKELLRVTVKRVLQSGRADLEQYLVDNLADANKVCAHGRSTRLADTLAMAQDIPILPEALIKQRALEKLQALQTQSPEDFKQQFQDYTSDLAIKNIITSKQRDEFNTWADAV